MKRNDWILLGVLSAVGLLALLLCYAFLGGTGEEVVVTVDGNEVMRLPLSEDTEVTVTGYGGGTNTLVIQDGKVWVREASCPDQICVHTGYADEVKSIVCLPNRVVVSLEQER